MSGVMALNCPFCGRIPNRSAREGSQAEDFAWFAFIACFCGGYSACAHKMAGADTESEASDLAAVEWNTRRYYHPAPALGGGDGAKP